MKIAIYARYSSENQHERSIDDQIRLCRERACALGGNVVDIYADYAVSGAHLKTRPQAMRLLKEAQEGRFDVVISEALDRLSRDQEDVAAHYPVRRRGRRTPRWAQGHHECAVSA
jgi:site-specific DNA recombinase